MAEVFISLAAVTGMVDREPITVFYPEPQKTLGIHFLADGSTPEPGTRLVKTIIGSRLVVRPGQTLENASETELILLGVKDNDEMIGLAKFLRVVQKALT